MDRPSPLAALRARLALPTGENAVFDGWTKTAVNTAADGVGIDRDQARLAMPKTAAGLVETYIAGVDDALQERLPPDALGGLKIRDKIRTLVWTRLEIMGPAREAVRSALSILAMPQNAPTGLRTGWHTADLMWRMAGDTSTDYNHYTKRMTLGAVYASTLLVWLDDDSDGWAETAAFLDRRIDNVMQFEKWKAQWRGRERFSVSRFLGRLRYPAR